MKLNSIINSKVARFVGGTTDAGSIFLPDLAALMQKRFHFLQVPSKLEDYNSATGIKFLHGKFEDVIIDTLEVYGDGIIVNTKANSKHADSFVEEVIRTAHKDFKMKILEIPKIHKSHTSSLEVYLNADVGSAFNQFKSVYKIINAHVASFADEIPPYQVTGILMHCDLNRSPHFKPPKFVLERRSAQAFDSNLYYSEAPLTTDLHLEVLEEIEKSL